ncbi:MAG: hypothetical protein AABW67_02450, partial [Nanoarchaeota archaeon]
MKIITKLTKKQEAQMNNWAKKWIEIGLSTEEANWENFNKGVRSCYNLAGLNPNIPIIKVQSPIVGALASSVIRYLLFKNHHVDSAVYSAVRSVVNSAVDSAVRSVVGSAVYSAVRSVV